MPRRARAVWWLLASLVLVAGAGSAGAVVNTGQDASTLPFVACNGRVGFRTVEQQQAGTDLNGDGDPNDIDLQVLDLTSGLVTNVGVDAGGPLACGGDVFAFGVREASQGNADRNGDGDTFDTVLAAYDAGTSVLTNLGLAVSFIAASPDLIAFTVNEASQGGIDRNGDGDVLDKVLHVLDPTTLTVTNVGVAADETNIKVVGKRVAFLAREAEQGNTDLNGDGDPFDTVFLVYDAATATLINPHRAADPVIGIQLDSAVAAFVVPEQAQGPSTLNGDLDMTDDVLHLYCFGSPPCVSSGLINVGVDSSGGFTLGGDVVAIRTNERDEPGPSLNPPDIDTRDIVVQYYRISTGTVTDTGLAARPAVTIAGGRLAIGLSERYQNASDHNGDLDHRDIVLHVYDTATDTAVNTGRAIWAKRCLKGATNVPPKGPCMTAGTSMLLFAAGEREQNHTDLNGDGDFRDPVVEVWRWASSTLVNTGLAAERKGVLVANGTLGAFRVSEKSQQAYLNGDLDQSDRVVAVYDDTTGTTTVLGQAADELLLIEGSRVVFRTNEAEQNTDLNGDGDMNDAVLQYQ